MCLHVTVLFPLPYLCIHGLYSKEFSNSFQDLFLDTIVIHKITVFHYKGYTIHVHAHVHYHYDNTNKVASMVIAITMTGYTHVRKQLPL